MVLTVSDHISETSMPDVGGAPVYEIWRSRAARANQKTRPPVVGSLIACSMSSKPKPSMGVASRLAQNLAQPLAVHPSDTLLAADPSRRNVLDVDAYAVPAERARRVDRRDGQF